MIQLHLTGPLGQQISIECQDYPDSLAKQREWGARGFMSGDVPTGGYQLPYCMADTFDWALIGARKWTNPEGEEVILHRGKSYKRREMEANEKKNMPAVIKYSRGAKGSDPEHVKEGEDGSFQYVTLAVFKGGGKSIPDYEVPREGQQRPTQAQQARAAEAAPEARNWAQEWRDATSGTIYAGGEGRAQLAADVAAHMGLDVNTFEAMWNLKRADVRDMLINTAKAWIAEDRQKQAS